MLPVYSDGYLSRGIAQILFYQTVHGNMDVEEDYVTADRFPLGEFVRLVRDCYKKELLKPEQVEKFSGIGFSMEESMQAWESMLFRVKKYKIEHGGNLPKPTEHTPDQVLIGAWVRKQRLTFYSLSGKQQERLREIGL